MLEEKTSMVCGQNSKHSVRLGKLVCEEKWWEEMWPQCFGARSWRVVSTRQKSGNFSQFTL